MVGHLHPYHLVSGSGHCLLLKQPKQSSLLLIEKEFNDMESSIFTFNL